MLTWNISLCLNCGLQSCFTYYFLDLFTAYICFPFKVDFCLKKSKINCHSTLIHSSVLFRVTLFFIEFLVCTVVCVWVYTYVYLYIYVWKPEVHVRCSSVLPSVSLFQSRSLTEPWVTDCIEWLVNEHRGFPVSASQYWECQCIQPHPTFYICAWELNSGPYMCNVSTLHTRPSPWPPSVFYFDELFNQF